MPRATGGLDVDVFLLILGKFISFLRLLPRWAKRSNPPGVGEFGF